MISWGTLLINTADQRLSDEIFFGMLKEAKILMYIEANFVFKYLGNSYMNISWQKCIFNFFSFLQN